MNKQLYINGDHRFPVSTEALEFIQQQIFLVARLCHIVGANVIIKQPAANANPPASWLGDDQYDPYSGLVIIAGKLYPLYGNSALDAISIYDATDSVQVETSVVTVRSYHFAQYTANGRYPLSTFTTTDTIVHLMQRISAIEDNYLTETAIRALVQSMQTEIDTTGNNLSSLINRVATIENNYRTAAQINELLAANAQHHLPKGSVIDWSHDGYIAYDDVPYGYIPCGKVIIGTTNSMNAIQLSDELNKWKNHYTGVRITNGTIIKKNIDNIIVQYSYIQITEANGVDIPDLTDRFIMQAGYTIDSGKTGGDKTATLTINNMPNHKHDVVVNSDGSAHRHQLEWPANAGGGSPISANNYIEVNSKQGSAGNECFLATKTNVNNYDGKHTHTITETAKGNGTPFSIIPPYFALYKLIKVI